MFGKDLIASNGNLYSSELNPESNNIASELAVGCGAGPTEPALLIKSAANAGVPDCDTDLTLLKEFPPVIAISKIYNSVNPELPAVGCSIPLARHVPILEPAWFNKLTGVKLLISGIPETVALFNLIMFPNFIVVEALLTSFVAVASLGFSTVTYLVAKFSFLKPFTYDTDGSTPTANLSLPNVVAAEVFPASPSAIICAVVLNPKLVVSSKYCLRFNSYGDTA